MAGDANTNGGGEESHAERINRELIELLNELRVALPGVQVLFAFLLAVPFATGFKEVTEFQRELFFGTLASTAVASALLIAPSAYHRMNFREKDKERMLLTSNGLFLGGLFFLALSITAAVTLIADFLYGSAVPIASAALGVLLFVGLWLALPIVRRNPDERPDGK